MPQMIALDTKTAKELIDVFRELKREVVLLREKIEEVPGYGTREWWDKSTKKAMEEVTKGEVYEALNLKDALRFLHS